MKRIIAIAIGVLGLLAGIVGISTADPGPNGNNDHGLCTAYFNGQKNGHGEGEDQSNQPPPFQGLEDAGRDYTDNDGVDNDNDGDTDEEGENTLLTDAENIFNYCDDESTIGGQSIHGRFACADGDGIDADGSDSDSDPECNENPEPGKS